ncbi:hypothetical protein MUK51_19160 [Sphingobacterium faecium]|uniref:hypothetical protein n=1 Tax=Sphingobacterium faecium TaxID=34087 RepID=UPI0021B545BE|nr:hypothetical protein [Sphingobacterium faecium]UXD69289.1 hypothetical protein MUK51_19160 [Sphingobacterium faecium]
MKSYDTGKIVPDPIQPSKEDEVNAAVYVYPFGNESGGVEAEITLTLASDLETRTDLIAAIPPLKYNKSLLVMLTQDDCKQSAFSMTWAAIHGKPIDLSDPKRKYYYDIENLEAGDLPPHASALGKTLGSTDGFGNEIRFHFTTTVAPEWGFMRVPTSVKPGFTGNYYRFYMKSGLRWNNVRTLVNTGNAIAFHDVNTLATHHLDSVVKHLAIAQQITQQALGGRKIKFLAEPNGNKTYLAAALQFPDIQTMTAQSGASVLIPYQVASDLHKTTLERVFVNHPTQAKDLVLRAQSMAPKDRPAVHLGVHETDREWAQLLLWLNDHYGQDGQDVLWFPSQEEYYEYHYYRQHSDVSIHINGREVKIKVKLPRQAHFYYPSLTLNIPGLKMAMIKSVHSNESVTGLSYGDFGDGISINFDSRKYLFEHADHYVKKYQSQPSKSNLADAKYQVSALKDNDQKKELLKLLD